MSASTAGPPPVADLPLEALLARAEELARRWAVALVVARPLAQLGGIPLEDIARDAPALCERLLCALGSDAELERLLVGDPASRGGPGAAELGALAGVREPAALVAAAEALRQASWELVLDELPSAQRASGRRVAAVCDRLAYVCAAMLGRALEGWAGVPAREWDSEQFQERSGGPRHESIGRPREPIAEPAHAPAPAEPGRHAGGGAIAIVDERAPAQDDGHAELAPEDAGSLPLALGDVEERSPVGAGEGVDADWGAAGAVSSLRERAGEVAEIAIRDERRGEGPAAWIDSIGGQLRRFQRERAPFAVLLVELLDLDRLAREQGAGELVALSERIETLLDAEMGGPAARASLTVERPGRYWLVVAGADRSGVGQLVLRLGHAVSSRARHRIVVGSAVCPEDGESAAALAAHADVGLYAARADARAAAAPPPGA